MDYGGKKAKWHVNILKTYVLSFQCAHKKEERKKEREFDNPKAQKN